MSTSTSICICHLTTRRMLSALHSKSRQEHQERCATKDAANHEAYPTAGGGGLLLPSGGRVPDSPTVCWSAESRQASTEQPAGEVIRQPIKPFRPQIAKRSRLTEPASRCLACSWVATASAREAYHKKCVQVVQQG